LSRRAFVALTTFILLLAFALASSGLDIDSLWNDEAWSVWAVHSPSLVESLGRVRADVHPPLYFLFLFGWVRTAGESAYAIRLLSAFFGLIGLAATYRVGERLFDRSTGFTAVMLLGASGFFIYYTREARMYTLLLALSALSTWVYLLWRERPTTQRTLFYAILMAAMLYTHYSGAFIILTHFVHLLVTGLIGQQRKWRFKFLLPYFLASLFYLPWLPIFLNQMRANPNGPLAIPVPTDWAAVAALVLILTGGSWWLVVAPFFLGSAVVRLRQFGNEVLLLLLWLLITPIGLLALNAWVAPVYQVRYAIAMLPAGALLLAYGLRWVGLPAHIGRLKFLPDDTRRLVAVLLAAILVIGFVQTQWTVYSELWGIKSPWAAVIRQMVETRQSLEPTITDLAAYSPSAYYDRQLGIRRGISLDLSWRLHNAWELSDLMVHFTHSPSIWVALPINTAKTWHILAALDAERGIGYRSSLVNMVFYRFDAGKSSDLTFRFGDWLRYKHGPGAGEHFSVASGGALCVELAFEALVPLNNAYSAGLHLVDITGSTSVAQWDGGLGAPETGDNIDLSPCIDIQGDILPGYYHLELVIYGWEDQKRLPLFEDSGDPALLWGDVLMLAAVDVTG
jgi:hypothetical protein